MRAPWRLTWFGQSGAACWIIEDADGKRVASVPTYGIPEPQDEENARLIAAAPDMLEALRDAAELVKTARNYFPKSVQHSDRFRLEKVNAAIGTAIYTPPSKECPPLAQHGPSRAGPFSCTFVVTRDLRRIAVYAQHIAEVFVFDPPRAVRQA